MPAEPKTAVPIIPPFDKSPRPFWSVMIPAYNPRQDYFEQMLRSVLLQDAGSEQMQIEVVDDCSPNSDVQTMVKSIGGGRADYSKTERNLGLAGCWNTCIQRARGQWVHILHQDDWLLPEFYKRFQDLIQSAPEISAAFTRHAYADTEGNLGRLSMLESETSGVLSGFDELIATWQRIECPAVIVKRSTYELLGGYRPDIHFVLDWEMWCRIASKGHWGYVPQLGAVFRVHPQSETKRLQRLGATVRDHVEGGQIARSHFRSEIQSRTARGYGNKFAELILGEAAALFSQLKTAEAAQLLDSFRREIMNSDYRMGWFWLRARVLFKRFRLRFSKG